MTASNALQTLAEGIVKPRIDTLHLFDSQCVNDLNAAKADAAM